MGKCQLFYQLIFSIFTILLLCPINIAFAADLGDEVLLQGKVLSVMQLQDSNDNPSGCIVTFSISEAITSGFRKGSMIFLRINQTDENFADLCVLHSYALTNDLYLEESGWLKNTWPSTVSVLSAKIVDGVEELEFEAALVSVKNDNRNNFQVFDLVDSINLFFSKNLFGFLKRN